MKFYAAMALASLIAVSAQADLAADKYNEAVALYAGRVDLVKNEKAITALKAALAASPSADLQYDINILLSRATYWKGGHTEGKDAKLALYTEAMKVATDAKALRADLTEGYYFYGIALGRWAETKGPTSFPGKKAELFKNMADAIANKTKTGADGETIDGFGPNRVYGRAYFKLPGLLGGSRTKALENLNKAYDNSPKHSTNIIYLAETLLKGEDDEKARGCQLLTELIAADPSSLIPDRTAEANEDVVVAKELKEDSCD